MVSSGPPNIPDPWIVCPWIIRALFNERRYYLRIARGEIWPRVIRDKPAPASSGEPPGSRSQTIAFVSASGAFHAVATRYLGPDGRIGGWGSNDPKMLRGAKTTFERDVTHLDEDTCPDCPAWKSPAERTKGQS
jgi:hypothetical protein